ncbi:hypothetical protein GCM10027051_33980 [Niabella terrae]
MAGGPKPELFPELKKFYESLNAVSPDPQHALGLSDLQKYILQGMGSEKKIDLVLCDKDNSFASVSAQLVLQSLLWANKSNKLGVTSCGYQATDINPVLIKVLTKHGYKVAEAAAVNGKKAYSVTFGTNMPTSTVYAKNSNDATIPGSFLQMKMCPVADNTCPDMKGAFYKEALPFVNPDAGITEDDADKLFTQIAAEVLSAFNKAKTMT